MKNLFLSISLLCLSVPAFAAVQGKEISYAANGTTMKGYIAYDDTVKGKRPAVLVVHEWWGHNEYARKRARMLAELGYTALAVDMYGDGKTAAHPKEAGEFAKQATQDPAVTRARFLAAKELLANHKTVAKDKIGAIGYCFGGGVVLNMARAGVDLKGVVSFHGSLAPVEAAKSGAVKAQVLVYNGADDQFTPSEQIEAFKKEMTDAKVKFEFVNLPGAKHSFSNPDADELGKKFNMPIAYSASADKTSWDGMQAFFKEVFK